MTVCTKCGTQVTESAKFCGTCASLVASPAGPQPAETNSFAAAPMRAGAMVASPGWTSATAPADMGAPVPASQVGSAGTTVAQSKPMSSNVAGLIAYILGFVTGIAMLVMEPYKNDKFVRFHALQSIFLSAVYILAMILWDFMSAILFSISYSVWDLVFWISWLVGMGFFVLWLFLMYRAYNSERFELPFIGPIAAKQAR